MRRVEAKARAAIAAGLVSFAILLAPGTLSAQTLPELVPLPPLPPLPKEGMAALREAAGPLAITPSSPTPDAPSQTAAAASAGPVPPLLPPGLAREPGQNTATAFNPAQRSTVEKINRYFNSISTLVGKFVQIGPDGKRSEGEFYLQKPGRVRFDYDPPSPVELISDGSSVAVRDRKLATQDLYPLSQTPLRFLLSDKIDLIKDANVVGVYQDELFITVVIEEKQAVIGTHRLMIMFGAADFQLKQWTVTDPQGYDTTVAISNLDSSQRPDPTLFKINYERMVQ
jgi:outer membrane lipoprotein-sorting protein